MKNYIADDGSEELIGTDVVETESLLSFQKQLDEREHPGKIMRNMEFLCFVEEANCNSKFFSIYNCLLLSKKS